MAYVYKIISHDGQGDSEVPGLDKPCQRLGMPCQTHALRDCALHASSTLCCLLSNWRLELLRDATMHTCIHGCRMKQWWTPGAQEATK